MRRWFVLGLAAVGGVILRSVPRIKRGAWVLFDLVLLLVGLGCIVAGVAHWSRGAAFIIAGLSIVALGVVPLGRRS